MMHLRWIELIFSLPDPETRDGGTQRVPRDMGVVLFHPKLFDNMFSSLPKADLGTVLGCILEHVRRLWAYIWTIIVRSVLIPF